MVSKKIKNKDAEIQALLRFLRKELKGSSISCFGAPNASCRNFYLKTGDKAHLICILISDYLENPDRRVKKEAEGVWLLIKPSIYKALRELSLKQNIDIFKLITQLVEEKYLKTFYSTQSNDA